MVSDVFHFQKFSDFFNSNCCYEIAKNTKPGQFDILFKNENGDQMAHTYTLKPRAKSFEDYHGFDSSDAIYLITPDRFVNGDLTNDVVPGMNEEIIDRMDSYARHGGDLRGMINHIDYIEDLGYTAVWPTPVLINDMHQGSYHGYAITDYYQVDPRIGDLEDYIEFSTKLKARA